MGDLWKRYPAISFLLCRYNLPTFDFYCTLEVVYNTAYNIASLLNVHIAPYFFLALCICENGFIFLKKWGKVSSLICYNEKDSSLTTLKSLLCSSVRSYALLRFPFLKTSCLVGHPMIYMKCAGSGKWRWYWWCKKKGWCICLCIFCSFGKVPAFCLKFSCCLICFVSKYIAEEILWESSSIFSQWEIRD